ncbi:alpha/beta hydrolase family protein [Caldalkalibacillus mannanilyticus]|uniref:alpha/beta hydrolase family protein n=1 Tax=Caldalkalibacillus mannanilyticus TaxID=1418 RepID=UPI000468D555|nr:prolyl oligopeptidase family serine peptidase [Caldalkalibacillus mannanilyticus]
MKEWNLIDVVEIAEFHMNARLFLVTYLSAGLKVKGYLAVPKGTGPFPALVYCRGGIRNVGMTRLAWVSRFVEQGYVVFAPFYRGNRGGEGREDFCGEDRHDVTHAIDWLKLHPQVDPKRLHLFGFSRGAVMALFAAMECKEVASVVVWGGVSEMSVTYEERIDLRRMLKRIIGGTPAKFPERYQLRSPIYFLHELECPVLIVHGTLDQQVGFIHARLLEEALHAQNKRYTTFFYEGEGHFFHAPLFNQAIERMFQWLNTSIQ